MLPGARSSDHVVSRERERPCSRSKFAPWSLDDFRISVASYLVLFIVIDCDGGDLSALARHVVFKIKQSDWMEIHPPRLHALQTIVIVLIVLIMIAHAFPALLFVGRDWRFSARSGF